jgi:acetate kinase
MRVLVFNCGSSSVKFQLIEMLGGPKSTLADQRLARGLVERIGNQSSYTFEVAGNQLEEKRNQIRSHEEAVRRIIDDVNTHPQLTKPDAIGHRVVHGGDRFTSAVLIDDSVLDALENLSELAPLHNPAGLSGIRAAQSVLNSSIPMVAAFDTAFHHTLPERAYTYAIPAELSAKHGIRRYGFHGLAHQYAAQRYAESTGTMIDRVNLVTLHLGNGCSACAIRRGESVDTSMGFTPLEGLVMGTRSGDLDPALVGYLARKEDVSVADVENWLNNRSGLLGLSGVSSDMRELIATMDQNPRSRLAIDVFCDRVRKYLGAYLALLGGAEAVIFSGGVGENSPLVREKICADMKWCGLQFDHEANMDAVGNDGRISSARSRMKAYVVRTDEEVIIAREAARLIGEREANEH